MKETPRLRQALEDHPFWENMWAPLKNLASNVSDFFTPSGDARRSDNIYELNLELPGVSDDDVDIALDGDLLTVRGEKRDERSTEADGIFFTERSYGRFERSFRLPEDADRDGVEARFDKGILTIKVPRRQIGNEAPKRIKISKK
ncbi:Hsp20/alpha crystallin family protein [Yunchengibacter salinarum]|uniref:Hsp20/alpha crystallin family protein n=1 Tax=Yunchengibacter salinarum TaxID=3133399 RepID=UPI0035B622A9